MRVLLLHNKYNQQGGEDIVVRNEFESLQRVLGTEYVFRYEVQTLPEKKWDIIRSMFYSFKQYNKIHDFIISNKIDIVHIHNYFPLLSISVFKAAKKAGAKVIHTVHNYKLWCIAGTFYRDKVGICTLCTKPNNFLTGIKYKCYRNSYLQSAAIKIAFWNYKRLGLLNDIDKMIVLSQFQLKLFTDLGIKKDKMILKSNMVQLKPTIIDIHSKKDYLFIGRLEKEKGIEFLIQSWIKLPATFILTVIGSGSLDAVLKIKYAGYSNIKFLGEIDYKQVSSYIQKAKYTIQPSLWYETFGLTIIESMMLGTPVIGLEIGTRTELIESGKNGFLCSESNFVETIMQSNHFDDYENLCQNAIASSVKYRPEQIIQQQLAIYKEVLNQ